MFLVSTMPLDPVSLTKKVTNPRAGGFVSFEGWVRNHHQGRDVLSLEYEVYEKLALKEGQKVIKEALDKFDIFEAVCVHRAGHLTIGDLAVWVGISAAHRKPAFEACSYVIDEVKHRLPIWKKEHYVQGPSEWVRCTDHQPTSHTH